MHPGMVAPLLPDFVQAWCQALYEIRDNEEKDSAFRGLCTLVQTNPAGIAKVGDSCDLLNLSPLSVYISLCLTSFFTSFSLFTWARGTETETDVWVFSSFC